MKQARIIIFIGFWIIIVSILGIPIHIKKILMIIPGLFLITIGITELRMAKKIASQFDPSQEELITEIAEDIADDILEKSAEATKREMNHLRDIL